MSQSPIDLKGEMHMQNVLHIHSADVSRILQALQKKRDEAPQFFLRSPIVVDCKLLADDSVNLDFPALLRGLRAMSFVPVGIRHVSTDAVAAATEAGWAILRDSAARQHELQEPETPDNQRQNMDAREASAGDGAEAVKEQSQSQQAVSTAPGAERVKVIAKPVRSGQQVYAPHGDIVVLSQTGAGSEVLADGSVHVYGKVMGRVLAGVNGDRTARIFCQGLNAELIAIAGNYQLLDELDTPLKGKPAMISLQGEKLKIEPIA